MNQHCGRSPGSAWGWMLAALALLQLALLTGCGIGGGVENPSFPLTVSRAHDELEQMRELPVRPARPVVVIGGLFDAGIVADDLGDRIKKHTSPSAEILVVSPFGTTSVDSCRRKVLTRIEERFPSGDPNQTVEVDVVGFSLGGVVARFAALEAEERARAVEDQGAAAQADARSMKRLNAVRVFCISVPNAGSAAAEPPTLDQRVVEIRPDSSVLKAVNNRRAADRGRARAIRPHTQMASSFAAVAKQTAGSGESRAGINAGTALVLPELICYTRLEDRIVNPVCAAPPGEVPFWVSNLPFELAHAYAYRDPRILADICRRLRGEAAYTHGEGIPVPGNGVKPVGEPEAAPVGRAELGG